MSPAIISLIIALAPYGEELLVAIIGALVYLVSGGQPKETILAVTKEIIDGINKNTAIPQQDKARYIADAIAQWHIYNPVTVNQNNG